ncbi:MAG: hypothetical protein AAFR59_04930, partial [Bacteroidota bacterium]
QRKDRQFTFQEMKVVWAVFEEILGTECQLSIFDLYRQGEEVEHTMPHECKEKTESDPSREE